MSISIHALLAESDSGRLAGYDAGTQNFYPRSPCGERRRFPCSYAGQFQISIHALLAESDAPRGQSILLNTHFYPRSPCGERHGLYSLVIMIPSFLSTLSLRRATFSGVLGWSPVGHFYPRSPCGERPLWPSD